jgi:Na+-transporting methylmalonyl-CoA/oxaloacetate decarboxylase gamma subunit
MSVTEELARGLELTLTGMVTVFILLTLMVLIQRWFRPSVQPSTAIETGVTEH